MEQTQAQEKIALAYALWQEKARGLRKEYAKEYEDIQKSLTPKIWVPKD